jgi:hypothetical protein
MNMLAQNAEIRLVAELTLAADRLVLSYEVENVGRSDIYLLNKVYRALPRPEIDENFAYVFLSRDGQLVVEKDIPPVPPGLSPTSLVVPYMTVVRAGARFAETVELGVPVRQYIEYVDNSPPGDPRSERIVTASGVVLALGYFVRPPGATERFEQALGQQIVLFHNPPGARARHERLLVGPIPVELPVFER